MKRSAHITSLALLGLLHGCDATGGGAARVPGGVAMTFTPATNEAGTCQPERESIADVGITGLFGIRGDSTYTMPGGDTRIPFQSVFKYPDESGYADDKSITILNFPGACTDLAVKIRIDYCEYDTGQGRAERPCPDISVGSADGFSSIEIIRADLEKGDS